MKSKKLILVGALLVLIGSPAFADLIVGSGGSWQTWVAGNADQDGSPYWDGNSNDSASPYNVGNIIVSQAGGPLPFWGQTFNSATDTGGGWDLNVYLNKTAAGSNAAIQIEVAGYRDLNSFGWYDITAPATLNELFSGPANAGASATFTPSTNYGFYFKTPDGTFYTQSSLNAIGYQNEQHFAFFKQTGDVFWIGMEDLKGLGDRDWNDMVVKVKAVPEPATMIISALTLIGAGGFVRRKFFKQV